MYVVVIGLGEVGRHLLRVLESERTDIAAIDIQPRVIAEVEDPYASDHSPPLSVGLFVEASISGTEAENVVILPRSSLRGEQEVLVIDEENRLRHRKVELLRVDAERDRDQDDTETEREGEVAVPQHMMTIQFGYSACHGEEWASQLKYLQAQVLAGFAMLPYQPYSEEAILRGLDNHREPNPRQSHHRDNVP